MPTVSIIPPDTDFLRDVFILLEQTTDQVTAVRSAIVGEFSDAFDHEKGPRRMIGQEMVTATGWRAVL